MFLIIILYHNSIFLH